MGGGSRQGAGKRRDREHAERRGTAGRQALVPRARRAEGGVRPLAGGERGSIQVVVFRDFSYSAIAAIDLVMHARYEARLVVWLPSQMMAEHWYPDIDGKPGKEATFRVLWP